MDGVARRAGLGAGRDADRLLSVQPGGRGAAADSTEVLVWYSADRDPLRHPRLRGRTARCTRRSPTATRSDRDDNVQILLGTFNDGRQASVFAVNPLGVQSDGALVETGSTSGNGFNNAVVQREAADLSPDYVFESKGRLTDYGYEVEVRIPFKSLRFQPAQEQRWGINVTRQVQHSGARGLAGRRPSGRARRSWRSRGTWWA